MKNKANRTSRSATLGLKEGVRRGSRMRIAGRLLVASLVLLSLVVSTHGVSGASEGDDTLWSLRFDNVTVAEALKALTRATGVTLYANRSPGDKRVNKAYENQTIEQIVRDVFRGESYTLVWNYGREGLESIGIWFVEDGGGSSPGLDGSGSHRLGWNAERRSESEYGAPEDIDEMDRERPSPRRPFVRPPRATPRGSSSLDEEEAREDDVTDAESGADDAEPSNPEGSPDEEGAVEDETTPEDESAAEDNVQEETDDAANREEEAGESKP